MGHCRNGVITIITFVTYLRDGRQDWLTGRLKDGWPTHWNLPLNVWRNASCATQHDAVSNLRKAKSLYVSRHQEYDKVKEQASKAETESVSLAVAGSAAVVKADARIEKKKKLEDDALQKVSWWTSSTDFLLFWLTVTALSLLYGGRKDVWPVNIIGNKIYLFQLSQKCRKLT